MWPSYESWRKTSLEEQLARAKIERDALIRQVGGALLLAGAIVMGASRREIGPLEIGMVVIGGQVIVNGFNVSKQAEMHSEAIRDAIPGARDFIDDKGDHYEFCRAGSMTLDQIGQRGPSGWDGGLLFRGGDG